MADEPLTATEPPPFLERVRWQLRGLYFGRDREAIRFQVTMLFVDIVILGFFIAGPYLRTGPAYIIVDYVIAAIIAFALIGKAADGFIVAASRPFLRWQDSFTAAGR